MWYKAETTLQEWSNLAQTGNYDHVLNLKYTCWALPSCFIPLYAIYIHWKCSKLKKTKAGKLYFSQKFKLTTFVQIQRIDKLNFDHCSLSWSCIILNYLSNWRQYYLTSLSTHFQVTYKTTIDALFCFVPKIISTSLWLKIRIGGN